MKITLKRIEEGICPYCGGEHISYGVMELQDDMMINYPAHCNECGKNYEEWYSIEFIGHNVGTHCDIQTWEGEEGREIDIAE